MSLKAIMAAGAMLALMATPGLSQEKPKTHEFNMATGWSGGPLMDIGAKAFADKTLSIQYINSNADGFGVYTLNLEK